MATENSFDCWDRARIDPEADFDGHPPVRTIFGYGSLIFRPGFEFKRAYPACVRGYVRRFWQRSCDHRGTPEFPGRVVTLVRAEAAPEGGAGGPGAPPSDPGMAAVDGVAYEVGDEEWGSVLAMLDVRERHGYVRTISTLYPPGAASTASPIGRTLVYHVHDPRNNAAYAGPEGLSATADVIAVSAGPSGRNDDYLHALSKALRDWALPPDPYLEELTRAVRERQSGAAAAPCRQAAPPPG